MHGPVILVLILMLAVVGVLFAGFAVMIKGGKTSEKYSNKLMFARVWLQAGAIGLLVLLAFFAKNHS